MWNSAQRATTAETDSKATKTDRSAAAGRNGNVITDIASAHWRSQEMPNRKKELTCKL
jgi:hypothetical protein